MTEPATIVIFGASGDLTARKLIPALFDNFCKGRLHPQTRIVGIARTAMSDDAFREKLCTFAKETLGRACDDEHWEQFAGAIHYQAGDLTNLDDYHALSARVKELEGDHGGGRLYYLAIAPSLYGPAVQNLSGSGLALETSGWRRVIVEKPFGRDLASARELNAKVHDAFDERQVYRIDHYLGKETVQNLLVFRFANSIFEPVWNRNYVDNVQITVGERVKVGSRGGYYNTAGVLRDMFQNHMMQVLAMVALEPPSRYAADALRDEKVKVFNAVRVPDAENVEDFSVVGQYAGYHTEQDVPEESITPTYAAVRLDIDNWRWQGVPFFLRSGKAMACKTTQVVIQFKRPPHLMFNVADKHDMRSNRLTITIQPDEAIKLSFQTKVPDAGMTMQSSELEFLYEDSADQQVIPDAYERLLLDALNGDASLFIRSDEIELSWRIMDPVINGWSSRPDEALPMYKPGTWGPIEADGFIRRHGRRWINDGGKEREAERRPAPERRTVQPA